MIKYFQKASFNFKKMELILDKDKYMEWLRAKGLANHSIFLYCDWIKWIDFKNFSEQSLLDAYYKHPNQVMRATIYNLFLYIKANKTIYSPEVLDLVKGFEFPQVTGRKKKRVINIVSKEEVFKIIKIIPQEKYKLIILLSFVLGLRRSEALNLKFKDFNFNVWLNNPEQEGFVRIIGKGNKERVLPVNKELMRRIYNYYLKDPEQEKLFDFKRASYDIKLRKSSSLAIGRRINPHLLRHSCASYLKQQGLGIEDIRLYLGHEDISTTQRYTYVEPKDLNKRILQAFG